MLVPVLYGEGISRDFTTEFNFIESIFGAHTDISWDGNRKIDEKGYEDTSSSLKGYFPEGSLSTSIRERFLHSTGKSSIEMLEARENTPVPVVEAVVYPDYNNIGEIIAGIGKSGSKALIYGGGTNVTGCFRIKPESRVIAVDTSKLNHITIKENTVTVGAGTLGADLEKILNGQGYTSGNFPESFNYSTVGGWIGTLENGQESNQYGGIENSIISLKAYNRDTVLEDRIVPRESSGLKTQTAFQGSEGRYGIIVEATLKAFKLPGKREFKSYFFKNFKDGIESIKSMDRFPSVLRLSDETETDIGLNGGKDSTIKRLFKKYLGARGVRNGAMMVIVDNDSRLKLKISGGLFSGSFPAKQWIADRYTRPAMANILWKHGYVPDTLETSATWNILPELHESTIAKFHSLERELGFEGIIMAHLSHMYETGACIYFTFIIKSENSMRDLKAVREAIMDNFIRSGAAISDHHGTGTYFRKYQDQGKLKMQSMLEDNIFSGWQNES